ncbi:MAG TPA: sigma-70 family RNA polymerase sigma factor [Solirubrobacterales bacterium]|nr:sigma-70 family RNA polymerase sigma factor [Solirubrobacterales bacterium]
MSQSCEQGDGAGLAREAARPEQAARKRAAVETYARHEKTLRRQARRFSLCEDDADDALQRALEILLRKAPTTDQRELIRWTQTVVKHEALAIRRERERILAGPAAASAEDEIDWVALIPAADAGPAERAERSEAIARSREALQALKPQELRALGLLAEGYSYREIGEITGYSQTKINRCLAEGRERFRSLLARSEDGRRCAEMGPQLSAFCDGEANANDEAELREHLRACSHCRATLRAYRAVPAAAAALAPTLPIHRSLFERAHDAALGLAARFGGGGGDSAISGVAATGGSRGAGMAALAKVLAVCAGTVGGAAACAATGVIPAPLALDSGRDEPRIERRAEQPEKASASTTEAPVEYEPETPVAEPTPSGNADGGGKGDEQRTEPAPEPTPEPVAESGAVEYAPPPPPVATSSESSSAGSSNSGGGDPAGEFSP